MKVLFVVGASSDMAMETIKLLFDKYDLIVGHYRNMNPNLESLKNELGERLILLQANLSNEDELEKLLIKFDELNIIPQHIIHFPAPLCKNEHFHKIEWEIFENDYNVSVRSFIKVAQKFLPKMSKIEGSKLLTIISNVVDGKAPKNCCNYVVTKYALLGAIKALASEYENKNIEVYGISPAWVDTKYLQTQPRLLIDNQKEKSPSNEILSSSVIADLIYNVLFEKVHYENGKNIIVDYEGIR